MSTHHQSQTDDTSLAIIVPVLNEIKTLPTLLAQLAVLRRQKTEVVIVDGGSQDGTANAARAQGFRVIDSGPGRARQMNAGARATRAEGLLFLHADTRLPDNALALISQALKSSPLAWGRFDVRIEGASRLLPVIAWFMNRRSRLTGIATGDQGLFLNRELFIRTGGFPEQPLMEDIELSKQLKRVTRPICLRARVTTSGRRWDERGSWRTILLMWQLRWAYWRGVPAEQLAARYQ
ncbi:glycosyl transferase [Marinobacter fuscus]|uniref:Glycosyl transferase n=1 Tax=Marinobacter fuscus TaxID=2109942 RepID=A0A2T1K3P1_9GAMM|nr:TIGR04283 family arsenosugar biosynthesis glycosyltransferase [Marinobacter fuscus]PSF04690.1 glycosyl transferase [Marinobacter fuscus]